MTTSLNLSWKRESTILKIKFFQFVKNDKYPVLYLWNLASTTFLQAVKTLNASFLRIPWRLNSGACRICVPEKSRIWVFYIYICRVSSIFLVFTTRKNWKFKLQNMWNLDESICLKIFEMQDFILPFLLSTSLLPISYSTVFTVSGWSPGDRKARGFSYKIDVKPTEKSLIQYVQCNEKTLNLRFRFRTKFIFSVNNKAWTDSCTLLTAHIILVPRALLAAWARYTRNKWHWDTLDLFG